MRFIFDEQLKHTRSLKVTFQMGYILCFFYESCADKDRLCNYLKELLNMEWGREIPIVLIQKLTFLTLENEFVSNEAFHGFLIRILQEPIVTESLVQSCMQMRILENLEKEFINAISHSKHPNHLFY